MTRPGSARRPDRPADRFGPADALRYAAMSTSPWARASTPLSVTSASGRRRPELVSLPEGTPEPRRPVHVRPRRRAPLRDPPDADRGSRRRRTHGDRLLVIEATIRHPGAARVVTTDPSLGIAANYDLWISDGETVRTWSAQHRKGTERPVRRAGRRPRRSRLPGQLDRLPAAHHAAGRIAARCVHPSGRASARTSWRTGRAWVSGTVDVDRPRGGRRRLRPSPLDRDRRRPARPPAPGLIRPRDRPHRAAGRDDRRRGDPRRAGDQPASRTDASARPAFAFSFPERGDADLLGRSGLRGQLARATNEPGGRCHRAR